MDKFLVKTLIEAVQEDNCSPLNNPLIWFANVTLSMVLDHLNTTFGGKCEEMCTAEHAKMQEVFDMSGPSIQPSRTKQENSSQLLDGTKQEVSDSMFVLFTIRAVNKFNFLSKVVLKRK